MFNELMPILVFEKTPHTEHLLAERLATFFNLAEWIEVRIEGRRGRITGACSELASFISPEAVFLPALYDKVLRGLPSGRSLLRVRNFTEPWTDGLWQEMKGSAASLDYCLCTADEVYSTNFFMELLTARALEEISKKPWPVMPPGYFDGRGVSASKHIFASQKTLLESLGDNFRAFLPEPELLCIDIMPICNYACKKCHYHSPFLPEKRDLRKGAAKVQPGPPMSAELLGRILKHAKAWKSLRDLHFYMSGEPLLHPDIAGMCAVARDLGFNPAFSSNGALLDTKMANRLLDAGIRYIGFSIDSLSPELYRELQGGDLAKVERNIMEWQELCLKRTGTFSGSIMCVLGKENIAEAEAFSRVWRSRGFNVLFNYELDINNRQMKYKNGEVISSIRPCVNARFLYLDSRGQVLICPAQINGSNEKAIDFLSISPEELWQGEAKRKIIKKLVSGERFDFCFDCPGMSLSINGRWCSEGKRLVYESFSGWHEEPMSDWKDISDWRQAK